MNIKFFTRSFNVELYLKSSALYRDLGYPVVRLTDQTADGYFRTMLADQETDIAINVDEDCFLASPELVLEIVQEVVQGGYANAGCADCGKACPRSGNPLVTNPFFNVLNLSLIRTKYSKEAVESFRYDDVKHDMIAAFDKSILDGAYSFDITSQEPYYQFFLWLASEFPTLYLLGKRHSDGVTTMLFWNEKLLCEHTWFARFYTLPTFMVRFVQKNKGKQKQRIDDIISEVYALRGMEIPAVSYWRVFADRLVRWSIKIPQRIAGWPKKLKRKLTYAKGI